MSSALPVFGFVTVHRAPLANGAAQEAEWLARAAATGRPGAHLWCAPPGLVVPKGYRRLPAFDAACAASAAAGWPVQVRESGGGLVPQGPGLCNLSLVWRGEGAMPSGTDAIYRELSDGLAAAFARLGVVTATHAVEGSFCDGRFNLAVNGRKLVGTAQAWKRIAGQPAVLAHAVVVVSADLQVLTAAANHFEAAAGSGRRYRADALTSVAEAWCAARGGTPLPTPDLEAQVLAALAERFARSVPLHIHDGGPRGFRSHSS